MLYHFLSLGTPFPDIAFIIKDNDSDGGCPPSCRLPALLTPFLVTAFIKEEAIGAINEAAKDVIIAPKDLPSCSFISCFTVSVPPSINKPDFFSDSTILIILSISSQEMNKLNPIPTLTAPAPIVAIAPHPLIFLSNLPNTEEVALSANLGKTSLAKGAARSISAFFPKLSITLPNVLPRNLPD